MTDKTKPDPKGITAADMRQLIDSLDLIEQEGDSFGKLLSASVEVETDTGSILATYDDGEWHIRERRPL